MSALLRQYPNSLACCSAVVQSNAAPAPQQDDGLVDARLADLLAGSAGVLESLAGYEMGARICLPLGARSVVSMALSLGSCVYVKTRCTCLSASQLWRHKLHRCM
jgi:hypothetical protein